MAYSAGARRAAGFRSWFGILAEDTASRQAERRLPERSATRMSLAEAGSAYSPNTPLPRRDWLETPEYADDDAEQHRRLEIRSTHQNGCHLGVRRLEADIVLLRIIVLHRRFVADEGN